MKDPFQEVEVGATIDLKDAQCGPCMHWWIEIIEGPLVRGDRATWMHVPLANHDDELVLGIFGVNVCEDDRVERQIPGGEPWVLPRVGHGKHIIGEQVLPVGVSNLEMARWGWWFTGIPLKPPLNVVPVELLAPDHSGEGLTHHLHCIGRDPFRSHFDIELISFTLSGCHEIGEVFTLPARMLCGAFRG